MLSDKESSEFPEGFGYSRDFLSIREEEDLLNRFKELDFQAFDFHGYIAKRRIVEYDFSARRASPTRSIPAFLTSYKERVAAWAALKPDEIVEAVITEYPQGAPIGWHRDVPQFEVIVGLSLKSGCRLRFKPYKAEGSILSVTLQPRSVYVIRDVARWKYQHSIPAVRNFGIPSPSVQQGRDLDKGKSVEQMLTPMLMVGKENVHSTRNAYIAPRRQSILQTQALEQGHTCRALVSQPGLVRHGFLLEVAQSASQPSITVEKSR